MKDTCIWGFSYGPPHNEAWKNKINELSNYFGLCLITTGRINKLISREKKSIIFKRSIIGIILFMIYSLWIMRFKYRNIIIVQRPNAFILFFWSILLKNKIIHIISNQWLYYNNISDYKIYFRYIFPRLKYIGITGEQERDIICSYPYYRSKTFLFLPIVNTKKYYYVDPPEITQFRILFASAPLTEKGFDSKGIEIMLKGFKKFSRRFNSKLIIIWRKGRHTNLLKSMNYLINRFDLDKEVIIINEEVKNMHTLYANSHIAILINKDHLDTPHYPQSLLEALSVGRPVVTSKVNEISDIIIEENVGSICDLNEDSVYIAIIDCYNSYSKKQVNARYVAEKYFDISNKTKLLEEILN